MNDATMTTYDKRLEDKLENEEEESSMSFLDHLDELRSRLIRVALFVFIAFIVCWIFSNRIYDFLQVPVQKAMLEAKLAYAPEGKNAEFLKVADMEEGTDAILSSTKDSKIGDLLIPAFVSIPVKAQRNAQGVMELVTAKPWLISGQMIKEGYVIPPALYDASNKDYGKENQLVVNNVQGAFNLYIKVAFYAAIFFGVPFILVQVWGFISPGLYPHEKKYALPFIFMASAFFMLGCAFAYYIAFPRAANFLLGVAAQGNIRPLVTVDEYFDLIITIMLGLGVVFEIPTVTFFLARLGLITYKLLLRFWRYAIIVIFIIAAVLSPTTDVPNLLVFAAPMLVLYFFSVGIAYVFHKDRKAHG
ncbi:MAG: twin-arginine translocase subunit TatC [Acidobacteria bacterium]|nr:twin-arginine translocase subunit TatC [Acidobacteriota bacterium]